MKKHKFSKWSHLYLLPVALLMVFVIAGCTQGVTTEPNVEDQPIPTKTWTILMYVCADNNLDEAGVANWGWQVMNNLEKAGSNDSINIVAQFDHTGANYGTKGAQRYYITRNVDAKVGDIQSPMLQNMGNTDMGDPDTLVNFVQWGMENYPANKYAIILWNHGGGWRNVRDAGSVRGIIYDDTSDDHLTELEVEEAFKRIYNINSKKIELIGFDACLMGAVEVTDDLKNYGKYYVCSERSEWAPGWPYQYFLNDLRTDPSYDGKQLSAAIVSRYGQFNVENGYNDYTLAGVMLERTTNMVESVDIFAKSAIENIDAEAANLKAADADTPSVSDSYPDFKDLKLLMTKINTKISNADMKTAATNVSSAVDNMVLYKTMGSSLEEERGGLSIWMPSQTYYSTYISEYRKLNFAKDTDWDDFLDLYVAQ